MKRRPDGFALLEIMVALAIIAAAVVALLLRMQSIANNTIFVEERTVAYWVAENKLQELLVDNALQKNIKRFRSNKDTLEYDGREWHWSSELEEIELPAELKPAKMYRLEIEVGIDPEKPMATLSAFVAEQQQATTQ